MWKEFSETICTLIQINDNDTYIDIIDYAISTSTTLFGIGISLFTLATAFIVTKKDAIKELSQNELVNGSSMTLARNMRSAHIFINTMRKIANSTLFIIFSALSVFVIANIFYLINRNSWIYAVYLIIFVGAFYLIRVLWILCKWYIEKL